jgi:Flavin reductase like domain
MTPMTLSPMPLTGTPMTFTGDGADVGVDADSFRAAMRELAGGVAVVTVGKDRDITGFTATSVSSLSAHPPRLLVCVAQSSASWLALQRYPLFRCEPLARPGARTREPVCRKRRPRGLGPICRRSIDDHADGHTHSRERSRVS